MKRGEMPSLRSYNKLITRLSLESKPSSFKSSIPTSYTVLLCLVGMVVRRARSGLSPIHPALRKGLDRQGHPTLSLSKVPTLSHHLKQSFQISGDPSRVKSLGPLFEPCA